MRAQAVSRLRPVSRHLRVRRGLHEPYDFVLLAAFALGFGITVFTGEPIIQFRRWMAPHIIEFVGAGLFAVGLFALARTAFQIVHDRGINRKALRAILQRHFGLYRVFSVARFCVAVEVLMLIYTTIKQRIPRLNPAMHDDALMAVERFVHFGTQPAWSAAQFGWPTWWLHLMDFSYVKWIPIKAFVIGFAMTHRNIAKRNRFLTAYLGLWLTGVMVGLAYPSMGPVYVDPTLFPPAAMEQAHRWQSFLLMHYRVHELPGGSGDIHYGWGLMAMPSLHVGAVVLYAIAGWGERAMIRWFTIMFAGVIFLGSLTTGWHYAIDGYAGALLAWLMWKGAGMLVRDNWTQQQRSAMAAATATAVRRGF